MSELQKLLGGEHPEDKSLPPDSYNYETAIAENGLLGKKVRVHKDGTKHTIEVAQIGSPVTSEVVLELFGKRDQNFAHPSRPNVVVRIGDRIEVL